MKVSNGQPEHMRMMMSKEQPEAMRMEEKWRAVSAQQAEEISRLHAENEALRAQLSEKNIGQGEPVAWIRWEWNRSGRKSLVFEKPTELSLAEEAIGVIYEPLYTHPAPQQIGQGVQGIPAEKLKPVIQWLEAGCEPKHAVTELRMLASAPPAPQASAVAFCTYPKCQTTGMKCAGHCSQASVVQQKPLTDEQINQMWSDAHNDTSTMSLIHVLARAIEAAHNIGEKK